MSDPHRLSINVTLPSGQEYRWDASERDTENVPTGLTFSSTVPGGFSTATFSLSRDIVKDYPDEALFSDVRITGPGGVVAWEGRIASLPREQGSSRTLTVGAVGYAAHLKDDQAFREIYVDKAAGSWTDIPLAQRVTWATTGWDTGSASWQGLNGGLSLSLPNQALSAKTVAELSYQCGSVPVAYIQYIGTKTSWPASWGFYQIDSVENTLTFDSALRTQLMTAAGTSLNLRARSDSSTSLTPTSGALASVSNIAAFGNHGLTARDPGNSTTWGFLLSDIVENVVTRAAPLLNIGTIEPTSYVITQAAYRDPTDAESVILDANKYELKRWGVWDNRRFDMWTGAPTNRTVWEARLSDGAQLQLEGDNAESVSSSVVVQYTDPNGDPKVIGPTGYSPADTTSDALLITDSSNPAVAAGVGRRRVLSLSFPTDASGAEQIGAVWLAEQNLPQRRGSVSLTGLVRHPTEGLVPAHRVRAGDFVRVSDRPGDVAREVTSASYAHDSHTVSLTVGGLPQTVDALLERVGVNVVA